MEQSGLKFIRISEDQKLILKKTFEKFPHHNAETLDLLSQKTGLRSELVKKWFEKRRIAERKIKEEDEIQILDESGVNSSKMTENYEYDEDSIELDNDDICTSVSSTSGVEMTLEAKAEEYEALKMQMEVLQRQLSQMSQSPAASYYYQGPGYNYHQPHQYPFPYHQPQYPPYSLYNGYSHGQVYNSNQSFWNLPYPPPNFQIVIPTSVDDEPKEEPKKEVIEEDVMGTKDAKEESVDGEELEVVATKEEDNKLDNNEETEESELNKLVESNENLQTKQETLKTVEPTQNEQPLQTVETGADKENVVAIPETETTEEIASLPGTTGEILMRYKDIDNPHSDETIPQKKYRLTPYKNDIPEKIEKDPEEKEKTEKISKPLFTLEENSDVTEARSSTLAEFFQDGKTCEETINKINEPGTPSKKQEVSGNLQSTDLSNVPALKALEEVSEKPDVLHVGDSDVVPKPFIVKKEPETPKVKLSRRSLPNKSRNRPYVPVETFKEADPLPKPPIVPPTNIKKTPVPGIPGKFSAPGQKTQQQISKPKPRGQTQVRVPRIINQKQREPSGGPRTLPVEARGSKRPRTELTQSRAKVVRQKLAPAPVIPTTITVTKVVLPPPRPLIPPSRRPELQRIMKMSNLSVSIK